MRGERGLLRLGEYLVRCASGHLPAEIRDERYGEWAAELPAILHDPDIKLPAWRAFRVLRYAAGTIRGSALMPNKARGRRITAHLIVTIGLLIFGEASGLWGVRRAPGDWVSYVSPAWTLLLACTLIWAYKHRFRPRGRRARTGRN